MTIRRAQGIDYERIAVQTHLIHIKEPLEPVFDEYVKPVLQPGDWLAVSEKFVTISQGRVIHHSVVRPGVLANLTRILADASISIDAMVQKEPPEGESRVDIVLLTHRAIEKNVDSAIRKIEKLRTVVGKVTRIRLEELL